MRKKYKQYAIHECACGCGEHPRRWDAEYVVGHRPLKPLSERLWSKVEIMPSGCWEWQGSKNARGYGCIGLGRQDEGIVATHRAAWLVTYGSIPDGLVVRHKCDNPPCCNPEHLELGTHQQNVQDAVDRNRVARGRQLPQTKLSPEQVLEIRDRYAVLTIPGKRGRHSNARELADEYGVSVNHLRQIAYGNEQRKVS